MADDKKIIFSMVGVSKAFQANKRILWFSGWIASTFL